MTNNEMLVATNNEDLLPAYCENCGWEGQRKDLIIYCECPECSPSCPKCKSESIEND